MPRITSTVLDRNRIKQHREVTYLQCMRLLCRILFHNYVVVPFMKKRGNDKRDVFLVMEVH